MYDPSRPNGHQSWPTSSPTDMILNRIDRLGSHIGHLEGRMEMGFDMQTRALTEGFRKADHAHGRITALTGRVEHLERFASTTTQAGTGATLTSPSPSRWHGLTELLKALGAVLPPLGTLAALIMWIVVATTAGVNADMIRLWIGLAK